MGHAEGNQSFAHLMLHLSGGFHAKGGESPGHRLTLCFQGGGLLFHLMQQLVAMVDTRQLLFQLRLQREQGGNVIYVMFLFQVVDGVEPFVHTLQFLGVELHVVNMAVHLGGDVFQLDVTAVYALGQFGGGGKHLFYGVQLVGNTS